MNVPVNKKYTKLLFGLCWGAYVASYLGRLNYSAVMAEVIAGGHLPAARAGLVVTAYFIAYGAGQLINGIAGDRIRPKYMVTAGLSISVAANVIMGSTGSGASMAVIWGVNGFAQSMLWPAVVKFISTHMSRNDGIKAIVNISTSVAAGTLLVYVTASALLAVSTWRAVFFAAAAVMAAVVPVWYLGAGAVERHAAGLKPKSDQTAIPEPNGRQDAAQKTDAGFSEKPRQSASFVRILYASGLFPAFIAVLLQGMLRDGVTTWTPVLVNAYYNLGPSLSALITALVPVVSIFGVYASYNINRKFFNHEIMTAAALFLLAALSFALLAAAGAANIVILILTLAAGISLMHGVNTMLISMAPMYFADTGKSSSVAGALNAFTYLGSGISSYAIGIMVSGGGWGTTLASWIVLAAAGMAACLLCRKKWSRFKEV